MKKLLLVILSLAMALGVAPMLKFQAQASGYANPVVENAMRTASPQGTPTVIIPEPYVVSPNQPVPEPRSTVGIINAVCDVTMNFVSCSFSPTNISIVCDTNADGIPELMIPLKDVTFVNPLLVRATIPSLSPGLAGSPFPLACCGGKANVVLSLSVSGGDDNIFGPFTETETVQIDLGQRAPVVISASPSSVDCGVAQNTIIPGSCFLLGDSSPNVTAVFAVERGNPANVIQAKNFVIINTNLIDALFDFGAANAGKTFLIYATGPNGTSRNLTALPAGTSTPCPLGNEQGVQVAVTCKAQTGGGGGGDTPPGSTAGPDRCELQRDPAGSITLVVTGGKYPPGLRVTVGGVTPAKVKETQFDPATGTYGSIIVRKRFCNVLPGNFVATDSAGAVVAALFCSQSCTP